MDISYDWYRIFCCVADCKNITMAAEKLFISQPAVSQSIRQLEESIGCLLFIRSPKGVRLTLEGELLYSFVSKGVKSFTIGEHKLKSMIGLDLGEIRIGASDMTLEFCLLPYLEFFHKKYPNIVIKITNNPTPQTMQLLKEGEIDFAVVTEPIPIDSKFEVIPIREIEDIFICGNNYEVNDDIFINDLPSNQLILLEKSTSTRKYIDLELEKRNYIASPKFELATSSLLVRFAERNLGISCVVADFALNAIENGDVRKIKLKDPFKRRNMCIVRKYEENSIAANKMINSILNDIASKN